MAKQFIGSDVAKVYVAATGTKVERTLYWGDEVEVLGKQNGRTKISWRTKPTGPVEKRYLGKDVVLTDTPPLKVRFLDVGQGDGAIVESPSGKRLIIDGGEEGHLRNYLRASSVAPLPLEAVLVTHGDADHFAGLTKVLDPQQGAPLVTVEQVFHNGLAKRPSKKGTKSRPDEEMFGATVEKQGELYCTELVDDVRTVPDTELNQPFQQWKTALGAVKTASGKKTTSKRLVAGSVFNPFPNEGVGFEVLGPVEEQAGGKPALRMLHTKPGSSSYSASHTVNGHSVVLRLTYGNVRILFAADLNEESEELLLATHGDLQAEVLKVPHHGSADFSVRMLNAVSPVVSIVSSGDEDASKDYIHPRAVLVGALGRASRLDRPLILVTEMVAFLDNLNADEKKVAANAGITDAHRLARKTQFGIVHVRTDGQRLLVVTRGANPDDIEAYAYRVDASHAVRPVGVTKA